MKRDMTLEEFEDYFHRENRHILDEVRLHTPAKTIEDVVAITNLTEQLRDLLNEYEEFLGVKFQ